jgi:hypothetical protein
MTKHLDVKEIERVWTRRYGPDLTRRMMASDGAAYDGRYGLAYGGKARDQNSTDNPNGHQPGGSGEQDEGDQLIQKVKIFLKNRLSPEDFQMLEQMLSGNGEEDQGQDQPEPFRGRPSPGGRQNWDEDDETHLLPTKGPTIAPANLRETRGGGRYAQDAAGGGYYDRFPMNARVDVNNYGN